MKALLLFDLLLEKRIWYLTSCLVSYPFYLFMLKRNWPLGNWSQIILNREASNPIKIVSDRCVKKKTKVGIDKTYWTIKIDVPSYIYIYRFKKEKERIKKGAGKLAASLWQLVISCMIAWQRHAPINPLHYWCQYAMVQLRYTLAMAQNFIGTIMIKIYIWPVEKLSILFQNVFCPVPRKNLISILAYYIGVYILKCSDFIMMWCKTLGLLPPIVTCYIIILQNDK